MKDLIIIGAAAAGCSAAVYASRRNLDFEIIAKDVGGEVAMSGEVGNWPGQIKTTGFQLSQDFRKHVESYDKKILEGWEVLSIKQEKNYHIVEAKNFSGETKTWETKSVIVASGIHPRHLEIPGEKEHIGKGVTYCTVCDGPLFREKITTTIGAGNSALESVLMLSEISEKAYIITKYPAGVENKHGFPKGEDILIEKILNNPKIEIINNAISKEIFGENMVEGLKYEDTENNEEKTLKTEGVMIHIGSIPNSIFVKCSEKTPSGEIIINMKTKTSCPGVFAAGDVTNVPYKQIAVATGQGVIAALSAIEYVNKWK